MAKLSNLALRKNRVRAKVGGTAERPRLSVCISNRNITAQLIDDVTGTTMTYASSIKSSGTLTDMAAKVGSELAEAAKKAKIKAVVFDRGGRRYAGRLKALAEAAREKGLEF